MKKIIPYAGAFLSGFIASLLPILAAGSLPNQQALLAALVPALISTGLFHTPSPRQDNNPKITRP